MYILKQDESVLIYSSKLKLLPSFAKVTEVNKVDDYYDYQYNLYSEDYGNISLKCSSKDSISNSTLYITGEQSFDIVVIRVGMLLISIIALLITLTIAFSLK